MPGVTDLLLIATGGGLSTITLDDVLTTATVGASPAAGHYLAPGVAVVKDGEFFGVDSAEEGSYVGGGGGGGVPLIGDGGLIG